MSAEPFVILPYKRWKLDQDSKKSKQLPMQIEKQNVQEKILEPQPTNNEVLNIKVNELLPKEPIKNVKREPTNLTKSFRAKQVKKLVENVRNSKGSDVASWSNLEELICNALNQSKKEVPNEDEFYPFLFKNNLGSFVKNRSKIAKFYKWRWFKV